MKAGKKTSYLHECSRCGIVACSLCKRKVYSPPEADTTEFRKKRREDAYSPQRTPVDRDSHPSESESNASNHSRLPDTMDPIMRAKLAAISAGSAANMHNISSSSSRTTRKGKGKGLDQDIIDKINHCQLHHTTPPSRTTIEARHDDNQPLLQDYIALSKTNLYMVNHLTRWNAQLDFPNGQGCSASKLQESLALIYRAEFQDNIRRSTGYTLDHDDPLLWTRPNILGALRERLATFYQFAESDANSRTTLMGIDCEMNNGALSELDDLIMAGSLIYSSSAAAPPSVRCQSQPCIENVGSVGETGIPLSSGLGGDYEVASSSIPSDDAGKMSTAGTKSEDPLLEGPEAIILWPTAQQQLSSLESGVVFASKLQPPQRRFAVDVVANGSSRSSPRRAAVRFEKHVRLREPYPLETRPSGRAAESNIKIRMVLRVQTMAQMLARLNRTRRGRDYSTMFTMAFSPAITTSGASQRVGQRSEQRKESLGRTWDNKHRNYIAAGQLKSSGCLPLALVSSPCLMSVPLVFFLHMHNLWLQFSCSLPRSLNQSYTQELMFSSRGLKGQYLLQIHSGLESWSRKPVYSSPHVCYSTSHYTILELQFPISQSARYEVSKVLAGNRGGGSRGQGLPSTRQKVSTQRATDAEDFRIGLLAKPPQGDRMKHVKKNHAVNDASPLVPARHYRRIEAYNLTLKAVEAGWSVCSQLYIPIADLPAESLALGRSATKIVGWTEQRKPESRMIPQNVMQKHCWRPCDLEKWDWAD
ncbi:uncharacterized protein MYCFIDRAFT_177477 [Pseudocercospora fijiensis CIRAD86]|uniref:Uncharacterized protein n=1 Tax=Pseudocercospora fijiensis (strain CIRAD86) TaxID=383855 RepID=M2ZN50_PSEFD|nr:uncharacterized protein MYCFIDRAFT_177477 [Pseudocercospora fijiensis CIRAD86]EME80534.1 hypothetical protein MYCFIDRAFT_177477 [Pseudocercospora fijiensis CIRAD86]